MHSILPFLDTKNYFTYTSVLVAVVGVVLPVADDVHTVLVAVEPVLVLLLLVVMLLSLQMIL